MKPRIGFNVDVALEESQRTVTRMNIRYSDLIIENGGIPVIFPPGVNPEEVCELIDGFLLIGGDDYRCGIASGGSPPERFVEVLPRRESADLMWANWLLESNLPVLGICGGLQILCLAAGGSLYGDIESEVSSDLCHRVVEKGRLPIHKLEWLGELQDCPAANSFEVNSSHHQSVNSPPDGWKTLAATSDGIIEAICDADERCVGIQWHPELMPEEPLGRAIVQRFVEQAKEMREASLA